MSRSTGVTVIAVLSLVGSLFTGLLGAVVAVVPFFVAELAPKKSPFSPGLFKAMMLTAALVYVLPAIWGLITSVGLFRLKEWARISTIVFSVLLILMGGFGGLMAAFLPFPPEAANRAPASIIVGIRAAVGVFWLALLAVGIWWLVFFTLRSVKDQFVPFSAAASSGAAASAGGSVLFAPTSETVSSFPSRPLSLTILAWLMLIGGASLITSLFLRSPGILFTKILIGWPAVLFYLVLAVVHLYVGIGLLRLRPVACSVGIVYYAFALVNLTVFYLAPGVRSRMLTLLHRSESMFPWIQTQLSQDWIATQFLQTPLLIIMGCLGLFAGLVPLYFLITRKEAFERAAGASGASADEGVASITGEERGY